ADPTNPAYANPGFIPTGTAGAAHPVPVQLAALLNSRAVPNGTWAAETYPYLSFPERATDNTNTVWQLATGLNFDLGDDWNGQLYLSHGESSVYTLTGGDNSLARWRGMVTQPDYGRNALVHGNQQSNIAGFGTLDVPCTSGFYDTLFLGDAAPSADCQYAVEATLQSRTQNQQDDVELNFNGPVAKMPAGELRAAAGFEYRKQAAQFYPDILQSTASFEDQVIGVYPAAYMDASNSVKDYYGELFVPVVKKFSLDLGARYSDYEFSKSEWTYKLEGDFDATQWLRLRGGYNRAIRAPNLGELFLGQQELFTSGGNFGDPCGLRSNAPFGAGGVLPDPVMTGGETPTHLANGQTAQGAMSTYLICRAQMGQTGADYFYSRNATGATGGGFAWVQQKGNADLQSETADTWTAGLQVTSPFHKPGLAGLQASIDWWKIDLSNAIEQYSIDYANFLCYGTVTVTDAAGAAAQAAMPACQNVSRTQGTGGPQTTLLAYSNQATIATSGIDLGVNWFAQFADLGFAHLPGGLGINVQSTWLDYYRSKQSPAAFDVETDWKGSLGPELAGTDPGAYSYRLFTSFNYVLNNKSFSLRWRHLPSVWSAGHASQEAIIENNERVSAGAAGVILDYTPSTEIKTPSYDAFDLSFNLNIGTKFAVRGGVDNLLDTSPAITDASRGYPFDQYNGQLGSVCGGAPGCQNPQGYSLASTGAGSTSAGYYDTLGRQYFVGFKVRF
ncbi:MAG TPA: TonB-dependent receptor, partial [Gammaproteobacteria bacterium]|nr:TonB-dependent receptor [Gammaproteobacteria bacterium]